MGKKNNFDETPAEQEVASEDEYYLPEEEETDEKQPVDKKLELALLKERNKATQLELEKEKFEFEKTSAEKKHELEEKKLESETQLEERKIAASEKANDIAEKQVEADTKKAKRERILSYIKIGFGAAGVIASSAIGLHKFHQAMIFEETGSFRTATGKDAMQEVKEDQKDLKSLDKRL